MSNYEQIAQIAHKKLVYEQIAHFLSKSLTRYFFAKNKQFTQKTDERIPSPDS